jgi:hypothetical protein
MTLRIPSGLRGLALDDEHLFITARIGVTKRFDFMDVKAAQAIGRLPA